MTTFFQIVALLLILASAAGWGLWVFETHRRIRAPETLSPILVHGIPEAEAQALADALAVGILGQIAEHTRVVAFINQAASASEGPGDIRALTRVSQPAPSLLEASRAPEALDISIELAGSKVETKGLQRFFSSENAARGALSISLMLEKSSAKISGLASSSFPPASAYGFAVPVEGNAQEIAERIGMRFVQAHYAASDSFYSALDPQDFRAIWRVRRRAAEIALRASGGGRIEGEDPVKNEAQAAYGEIEQIVKRYTRRPELQKLAAYLASASESYDRARVHLELVLAAIRVDPRSAEEQTALGEMIAALKTDADVAATPARSPDQGAEAGSDVSPLEREVLAHESLASSEIAKRTERVRADASARKVEVALVLGGFAELEPFETRVLPLGSGDRAAAPTQGDWMLSHTQGVAALIATVAPTAQIRVVKAIDANGAGSKESIAGAIRRAVAAAPEIIVLPLGPFDSESDREVLRRAVAAGSLVLLAAGNDSRELPPGAEFDGMVSVGAWEKGARASYSNYGKGVTLFAPGTALTFDGGGKLSPMSGTSYSVALASAVAANLAALMPQRPTPSELKAKLSEAAVLQGDARVLK